MKKKNVVIVYETGLLGNVKILASAALMIALSIVCGKFLAIPIGTVMRFSLENMPILFSAIAFGPLVGSLVAVTADLLGCLMVGYEINPIVTFGAFLIGFVAGISSKITRRMPQSISILISVILAHIIGSVVVKTAGLAKFYAFSYGVLLLWRSLNYLIVGILDFLVLYILFRNNAVSKQLEKIKQR